MITTEYKDKIQGMYFIHPNLWVWGSIKALGPALPTNFKKNMKVFDTDGMGLMLELETAGIERKNLLVLMDQLKATNP
jgi:hypothetical protein